MILFHAEIFGNLPRKSNSRQWMGAKRGLIKSNKALDYVTWAILQLNQYRGRSIASSNFMTQFPIEVPVVLGMKVWYQNRRSDLSDEIMSDVLQLKNGSGIIKDDNSIHVKVLRKLHSKDNPRALIWIAPLESYDEIVTKVLTDAHS